MSLEGVDDGTTDVKPNEEEDLKQDVSEKKDNVQDVDVVQGQSTTEDKGTKEVEEVQLVERSVAPNVPEPVNDTEASKDPNGEPRPDTADQNSEGNEGTKDEDKEKAELDMPSQRTEKTKLESNATEGTTGENDSHQTEVIISEKDEVTKTETLETVPGSKDETTENPASENDVEPSKNVESSQEEKTIEENNVSDVVESAIDTTKDVEIARETSTEEDKAVEDEADGAQARQLEPGESKTQTAGRKYRKDCQNGKTNN